MVAGQIVARVRVSACDTNKVVGSGPSEESMAKTGIQARYFSQWASYPLRKLHMMLL